VSDEMSAVCFTQQDAHQAATAAYALAQTIIANGQNALIECRQALEPITVKQRKFLHGPVLGQISEQVRIGGNRYVTKIWKTYFHDLFIPDEWRVESRFHLDKETGELVPDKRATPRRVRISTEELGVRAYSEFTEKVIDYATLEFGVVFHFTNEEQALRRKAKP
jgi:hypothetical protein